MRLTWNRVAFISNLHIIEWRATLRQLVFLHTHSNCRMVLSRSIWITVLTHELRLGNQPWSSSLLWSSFPSRWWCRPHISFLSPFLRPWSFLVEHLDAHLLNHPAFGTYHNRDSSLQEDVVDSSIAGMNPLNGRSAGRHMKSKWSPARCLHYRNHAGRNGKHTLGRRIVVLDP